MIKNPFSKINLCISVFCFVLICVIAPFGARAATLYLEPSEGSYHRSETFIEEIFLDTQGEEVNTVKVNLTYPKEIFKIVNFSDGGSILRPWVERPTINKQQTTDNLQPGLISFTGGIPNGFRGEGLLGKVIFKVRETDVKQKRETDAKIEFLEGTQVLLNDGFGTPAKLTTKGAILSILSEELNVSKNEWQEEIEKDNIPPEPFKIVINKDPSIFEGKYFITFSTTDKGTGIDYYEVKEGEKDWKEATSPYLLKDQNLKSIIKVKAVDKAGNERIEAIKPLRKIFLDWIVFIGIGVLIGGLGIYQAIKNKILKKPK